MRNVWSVPTGYVTDHILTMTVTAVQGNRLDFHQRALERVSRLSGVRNAAFAWGVPLTGTSWPGEVEIEGHPVVKPDDRIAVPLRAVTPGYFALLSLPIVEGRDFRPTDAGKAPFVAIVNHTLAERYFPNGSAIGKRLWGNGRDKPSNEIVGVVADSRPEDLTVPGDRAHIIAALCPRQPARLLGAGAPRNGCGPARGVADGLVHKGLIIRPSWSLT